MTLNMNQQLNKNFHLYEFKCKCGCEMPEHVGANIVRLVSVVLQPLRDTHGVIHVNSGYRCEEYNKHVGGVTHSKHILGEAADITVRGFSSQCIQAYLDKFMANLGYGGVGSYQGFTHVDIRANATRWNG